MVQCSVLSCKSNSARNVDGVTFHSSLSPNSRLVQRTIELNYTNKQRSTSLKWIVVNAVFLLLFVYDLSCKCPGYTSVLHYVELGCAAVLAANLLQYAVRLAPRRAPRLPLSPQQQKLLGLCSADLDSSFVLTAADSSRRSEAAAPEPAELSLWPRRSPPRTPPGPPRTPPGPPRSPPHSPPRSPYALPEPRRASPEPAGATFADDAASLAEYLERCAASGGPAPLYQLAAVDTAGGGALEESSPQGAPDAWARLRLDPQRLTQYNLNLRLWLHATVLQRLAAAVDAADAALARAALCEAGALREGRVPAARLRALAAHAPALAELQPFLEPFADQAYALRRVRELAAGGCLSAFRWDGGGAGWDASRPPDAELLLRLLAAYLDAQLPRGASARPFSDEYVAEGAAAAAAAGRRLALVRLRARPPHWALWWRGALLAVPRGRSNLLHALLLLLAAAAREDPPALARTHLGRAGLNMLWIIGR